MKNTFAVIDFETTGLSPKNGDRITEVAIILIESNKVVDQYQSLVKTGLHIPYEVERITGITNQMVANAKPANVVMSEVLSFVCDSTLVAHNASFDSKFFQSELSHAGLEYEAHFICTLLLSRRLYPFSPNLKLSTLAKYHGIEYQGFSHRALADAQVTAELFLKIQNDLKKHLSMDEIGSRKIIQVQRDSLQSFANTANQIRLEKSENINLTTEKTVVKPPYKKLTNIQSYELKAQKIAIQPESSELGKKNPEFKLNWLEGLIRLVGWIFLVVLAISLVIKWPGLLVMLAILLWITFK